MQPNLPFSTKEYRNRVTKVQTTLRQRGIDVLLVTIPENNYYLSGYNTTGYYMYQGLLVPASGEPVPIVRSLEQTLLETGTWIGSGEVYRDTDDPAEFTARVVQKHFGTGLTVGVEEDGFFLPVQFHRTILAAMPDATLVDASGIVEAQRAIKSPQELEYIRHACRAATDGLIRGIDAVKAGTNENRIAAEVYQGLLEAGSEYPGDQPYVAAGWRSGLAHATWSNRQVDEGDIVFLEIGGSINRYAGAHMRVVACGKPDPEAERRADVVSEALTAAIDEIKPGARSGDVDDACRGVIERAGYGQYFRHRTGYSLGLGFPPGWGEGHIADLKPDGDTELQPNTVYHLVPILHDPSCFGIGMSESVLVTDTGCEVLTAYPRELQVRPL